MNNRSFDIIYWLNHHKGEIFLIALYVGLAAFTIHQAIIGAPGGSILKQFGMWILGY